MKSARTLIAVAIAALSLNAHAIDISTDGSWVEFDFGSVNSAIYDLYTEDTSFNFSLSQAGILRVVDLGFSGDQFSIFANGNALGLTSSPLAQDVSEEPVFEIGSALADNRFSQGTWNLVAGSYTITGIAALSPEGSGFGAMSVTAVPEPESWAMLLAGLGVLGAIVRRRYSHHA